MLYSSGTTGRPKGVKWPLPPTPAGARTMLVDLLAPLFGYGRDCRYLSPAPLYHAAPLRHSMTVIKLGGTAFVMETFDAERSLQWIARHRITHSQWVPTMFVRMLKLPEEVRARYDLSSMQMAVHAAAPCPVDVKQRMLDWWGPIVHEYYAGTENNGFCSITPQEWLQHKGSVGRAAQGVLHICDEAGNELPAGETGLGLLFRRARNSSITTTRCGPRRAETRRAGRRWATSAGSTTEGYLYLVDRRAFMIISGGVNIYPQEAESVLIGHPQGRRRRGDRRAQRRPRRGSEGRRATAGPGRCRPGNGSGTLGLLPAAPGRLQVPAQRRLRRRTAQAADRQALQAAWFAARYWPA